MSEAYTEQSEVTYTSSQFLNGLIDGVILKGAGNFTSNGRSAEFANSNWQHKLTMIKALAGHSINQKDQELDKKANAIDFDRRMSLKMGIAAGYETIGYIFAIKLAADILEGNETGEPLRPIHLVAQNPIDVVAKEYLKPILGRINEEMAASGQKVDVASDPALDVHDRAWRIARLQRTFSEAEQDPYMNIFALVGNLAVCETTTNPSVGSNLRIFEIPEVLEIIPAQSASV